MAMQLKLTPKTYQNSIYSVLGFLVRALATLEKNWGSTTLEAHSFMRSLGLHATKDPDIYCLKTSRVCLVTTKAKLSRQYLGFLPTWGIELNGRFLIASTTEFHKPEKECSLSALVGEKVKRHPLRFLTRNQKNITGDYAFTVDTSDTGGIKTRGKTRKLTSEEKEQLQGFPKGWTKDISKTQRSKALGNAVTTNVVEAIGREILK